MRNRYMICYSIVSEESAKDGDYSETGIISEPDSLYCAIDDLFRTRTSACGGISDTSASLHNGRVTIYVQNGMEFETGDYESRSLHLHGVTKSTAARICRAAGVKMEGG